MSSSPEGGFSVDARVAPFTTSSGAENRPGFRSVAHVRRSEPRASAVSARSRHAHPPGLESKRPRRSPVVAATEAMSTALARLAFGARASTSTSALSSLVRHFGASRGFHGASGSLAAAKKGAAAASEEEAHTHSATVATGINIKKGGSDPELGADDVYPDWLWGLIEPRKTLTELEKEVAAAKLSGKYDVMDIEDIKRLVKLRRRAKIKASNAERAK